MNPLFGFGEGLLAPGHLFLLLAIGILVFGKRLPEIGRSLGSTLKEFKKGMQGVEDDVTAVPAAPGQLTSEPIRPPQRVVPPAPKFEDKAAPAAPPSADK
jgi:sec-independent protein translocase protein TatA